MSVDHSNPDRDLVSDPAPDAAIPTAGREEWVLQADAATIAGCSAGTIRKWRREGVVGDRRTTTLGGLERVEVRLQDVIDRCDHEQRRPGPAPAIFEAGAPGTGTVVLPLADLQALILSLGEAERRAVESTKRTTATDDDVRRLTDALARAEAGLAAARADADTQRRRVRDMEAAAADVSAHSTGPGSETARLREHVRRLEARTAESRSEIDGQRRRIRELESRLASAAKAPNAESSRLREHLTRLDATLTGMKTEMEGQRRQIADLEAQLVTASNDGENQKRRVAELEAELVAAGDEVEGQRRRNVDLEGALSAAIDDLDGQRLRTRDLEAGLGTAGDELEVQRRRVDELETALATAGDELEVQRRRVDELKHGWPEPQEAGPPPAAAGDQPIDTPAAPDVDPAATLRQMYQRLQARGPEENTGPDGNRLWVADLAAYDAALVAACGELGVASGFQPGDRLPAEERVRLTRDLAAAGLDVRQQTNR